MADGDEEDVQQRSRAGRCAARFGPRRWSVPGAVRAVIVWSSRIARLQVEDDRADRDAAAARPRWPTRSPTRLASPMMLLVTSTESSSRPLRPLLMMYARSNARSDSMTVMTRITMLIGRSTGNTTRKNVWRSLAPSICGGLAEARVDRLEAGEVEDHHVADLAPAGGDEHRPQVDVLVAQPVDHVALLVGAQDAVDEALGRRVLELPDEADDGQRQDDRQVQRALVEAGAADVLVQEHGEEDARCGVAMNMKKPSQMRLCDAAPARTAGRSA